MSFDLYALCTSQLSAKAAWQAAIEQQHFPLKFDSSFDPAKNTAFWPAQINEIIIYLEYHPLARDEWENFPNLDQPDQFIVGTQFSVSGLPLEVVSAVWAAMSAVPMCGGVVYDPQESKSYTGARIDDLVAQISVLLKGQVGWP